MSARKRQHGSTSGSRPRCSARRADLAGHVGSGRHAPAHRTDRRPATGDRARGIVNSWRRDVGTPETRRARALRAAQPGHALAVPVLPRPAVSRWCACRCRRSRDRFAVEPEFNWDWSTTSPTRSTDFGAVPPVVRLRRARHGARARRSATRSPTSSRSEGGKWKNLLLGLVVVPFFTSFLIRTIAWQTILGDEGPVTRSSMPSSSRVPRRVASHRQRRRLLDAPARDRRPHLQLPAVHDPADLREPREDRRPPRSTRRATSTRTPAGVPQGRVPAVAARRVRRQPARRSSRPPATSSTPSSSAARRPR